VAGPLLGQRLLLLRDDLRRAGHAARLERLGLRRTVARRRRRGAVADGDDRGAHVDGLARGDEDALDDAGERRRQLDERLGRLDLDEHLVDRHGVAGGDLPLDDLGLGQALADVGQGEFGTHAGDSS